MHYLAEIVKHSFERSYSSETVSCLLFWPSLDSQLHPKESQNPLLNNLTQAPLSSFSTHLRNKGPLLPTDYIILFLFTSLRCRLGKHSTMELHRQTSYFCVKSPLPGSRLSHAYYSSLGLCAGRLTHMVSSVLSIDENAAAEQGTWWWVSLKDVADGTNSVFTFPGGSGLLCLIVTSSLTHNLMFSKRSVYCNFERYSLWHPI